MKPQVLNAWLAALIDGEGSVMLSKRTFSGNTRHTTRRQLHFRAVVTICNADYRLIDALIQNTGVIRVYEHRIKSSPKSLRKRDWWTWRLANDDIRIWLPRVRPYLVLKGEQSDLLLEALDIKEKITPGNDGFLPRNRDLFVDRLKDIYTEIRRLNTKGRVTVDEC